jgi:hypothetical protein
MTESWLPWALIVAACLPITEEFVFPGGFPAWYRRWRGPRNRGVTPRFLVIVNGVLLLACLDAAINARAGLELRSQPPDKRRVLERLVLDLASHPKPSSSSSLSPQYAMDW